MWTQTNSNRWDRSDGAAVIYDDKAATSTSQPWKKDHRGWAIYSPTGEYPITYQANSKRFNVPLKFKTAQAGMKRVDKLFPLNNG